MNSHGDTASAFCFTATEPVEPAAMSMAITALQARYGGDLLRIKGLVDTTDDPGCPMVVHVVGHVWSEPKTMEGWPNGINATRIVAIIAGVLGFSGIAGAATQIAWILFVVGLIVAAVLFIKGRVS